MGAISMNSVRFQAPDNICFCSASCSTNSRGEFFIMNFETFHTTAARGDAAKGCSTAGSCDCTTDGLLVDVCL